MLSLSSLKLPAFLKNFFHLFFCDPDLFNVKVVERKESGILLRYNLQGKQVAEGNATCSHLVFWRLGLWVKGKGYT